MERILRSRFFWVVLLAAYGLAASVGGLSTVVPHGYELVRDGEGRQRPPVTEPDNANKMTGTALFTSDGSMYTKRHDDGRRLPRSLTEIDAAHDYVTNTTISLNPAHDCEGCPTTDTRELVKDTTVAPWDAIGLLLREVKVAASDTIAQCTGTLIGARRQHVLTAAHCLIDNTNATAYSTILFFPAASGSTEPFKPIIAHQVRVLQQYVDAQGVSTASLDADFGLITLSSPAPDGTTAMNIVAGENRDMLINLQTAGYPADKPPQTMWSVECPSMTFAFSSEALLDCGGGCDNIVVHDCLSTGGQSGSPIFSMNGTSNYTTHAILTGALSLSDGVILNTATQINSFVYNTIASWYNEDITSGLLSSTSTLMPSSSLRSSSSRTSSFYRTNRGYSSRRWWYFFVPIAAAAIILAAIIFCIIRRRRARPNVMAAASYPAVAPHPTNTGNNFGQYGTPNFNSYGTSGYPNVPPNNNSNYATGYPVSTPNFGTPAPYQASQYSTTYPQK